jgi:uncharacterized membrane protein
MFFSNKKLKASSFVYYLILFLFGVVVTRIGLDDLLNMRFIGTDFCFYDSSIWGAAQGSLLHSTILNVPSYLGIHFSPILFIFVPFYWLGAGSWILICARSAAAAGGSLLLRNYALKYSKLPSWGADILGISFLLHPMLQMASLSEFHGAILNLFFIPLFFVALASGKKSFIWFSLFFLLAVREDTWIYTTATAVLLLWREDRKLALQIVFVSIIWGILALTVWMPFFQEGIKNSGGNVMFSGYLSRYRGYTFSSLGPFLKTRLLADYKLLLPVVFLPVLAGKFFILMLIPLVQIQLGRISYQGKLLLHYSAAIIPFVYIAGIHGWERFSDFLKKKFTKPRFENGIIGLFIILFSFYALKSSIIVNKKYPALFKTHLIQLREKTAFELLKQIPEKSSLSLQGSLYLIGSHRPETYIFSGFPPLSHYPAVKTDYVIFDLGRPFTEIKGYKNAVIKILEEKEYGVVTYKDGFVVMKKEWPSEKNADVLWKMKYRIQGENNIHHQCGEIEESIDFDWKAARIAREGRDKEGALAFSVHRTLKPGRYKINFRMFLNGIQNTDAAGLILRAKRGEREKQAFLVKKIVQFPSHPSKVIFSYEFLVSEKSVVEPAVFYGGHGTVGLDYIEFKRI